MNKRRILAIAMSLCIVAILAVGASLADFTDTDKADNIFTTGKVDIKLNENFDKDNAKLLPGSQTKNAVPKEVKIALEPGSEDAYVWYEWLIPAALDSTDGSTGTNNVIHVNAAGNTWDNWRTDNRFWAEGQTEALDLEYTWDHDANVEISGLVGPEGFIGTEEIEGILYNKYVVLYHGKLSNAEGGQKETTMGMKQVYMDSKVDTADGKTYTINGKTINYDFTKGVHIIVRAYGIQAEGFDDVYAAYKAYNNIK